MRVTSGETISVGPGKISLLEAIRETRSITAAAKSIGMSYRRAWILIDELNASLKKPAVRSAKGGERGGGSELTEVGRRAGRPLSPDRAARGQRLRAPTSRRC